MMDTTLAIGNIGIGNTSTMASFYKDAGRLTFAVAKMGAEVIPGLLESIRNATTERREYGKGKMASFAYGARPRG